MAVDSNLATVQTSTSAIPAPATPAVAGQAGTPLQAAAHQHTADVDVDGGGEADVYEEPVALSVDIYDGHLYGAPVAATGGVSDVYGPAISTKNGARDLPLHPSYNIQVRTDLHFVCACACSACRLCLCLRLSHLPLPFDVTKNWH